MNYCDFYFATEDLVGGICDSVCGGDTVLPPSCYNSDQRWSEDDISVTYSIGNYSSQVGVTSDTYGLGASVYEFWDFDINYIGRHIDHHVFQQIVQH